MQAGSMRAASSGPVNVSISSCRVGGAHVKAACNAHEVRNHQRIEERRHQRNCSLFRVILRELVEMK
jgi:hypothetical protein